MKNRDVFVLVVVALLVLGGTASPRAPEAPRRRPRVDPGLPPDTPIPEPPAGVLLTPGWYWYWTPDADRDAFADWMRRNRGRVAVRKVLGAAGGEASIVIIEVLEIVDWELPGLPTPAPHGPDTTIDEIEHSGSPQLSRMGRFLDKLRTTAEDVVRYYDQMFQQWLDSKLRH